MSLAFLAAVPLAQVGYSTETLEVMVARADIVVRASVADVEREPLPNDWAWLIVTLEVRETLKGQPPEPFTFAEDSLASDRRFDGWKREGRELLVFFTKNPRHRPGAKEAGARFLFDRYSWCDAMFRLGQTVPEEERFTPQPRAVFTNVLGILEGPEAILEGTRRVAGAMRANPVDLRTHEVNVPRRIMEWQGKSGDANTLTMLVDPSLETLAQEMILSPVEVLSKRGSSAVKREKESWLDGYWEGMRAAAKNDDERREVQAAKATATRAVLDHLRASGAEALQHFTSDKNVSILRSLLEDNVSQIRKAAAESLEKMGAIKGK